MFMQNFNVVAPAVWLTHNFEWKCGEPHEKVLMKLINKLSSLKNRLILKHRYYSDFMYFWGKKSNLWYSSGKYDFSSVFFFRSDKVFYPINCQRKPKFHWKLWEIRMDATKESITIQLWLIGHSISMMTKLTCLYSCKLVKKCNFHSKFQQISSNFKIAWEPNC